MIFGYYRSLHQVAAQSPTYMSLRTGQIQMNVTVGEYDVIHIKHLEYMHLVLVIYYRFSYESIVVVFFIQCQVTT